MKISVFLDICEVGNNKLGSSRERTFCDQYQNQRWGKKREKKKTAALKCLSKHAQKKNSEQGVGEKNGTGEKDMARCHLYCYIYRLLFPSVLETTISRTLRFAALTLSLCHAMARHAAQQSACTQWRRDEQHSTCQKRPPPRSA